MTTGTPPEPAAGALRRWAAEQMELLPDVSAKESRAAFMEKLRDEDFMPPLSWQQASGVLLGRKAGESLAAQILTDEEDRLREAIESFAVEFFSLDVGVRQQRWKELYDQCEFSLPLRVRLRALEKGLRVPAEPSLDNPTHRQLAGYLRELFVLRPQPRAVRRQEIFAELGPQERRELTSAARQLDSSNPELAELEPVFIWQLTTWDQRAVKRGENRIKRRTAAASIGAPAGGGSSSGGSGWNMSWVIVMVVIGLARLLVAAGNSSSTSNPPPFKYQPIPTFPKFDFERFNQNLDKELFKQPAPDNGRGIKDKALDDLLKRVREGDLKTPVPNTRP